MPRGASARLFAALDPPAEVGEELLRWARGALRAAGKSALGRPRLLTAESLHVTLMFLGEQPFEEIDAVAQAMADAAARGSACELHTGAPVGLPPRRPRTLAVEVHDEDGALAALQRDLAEALCAAIGASAPAAPRRFRAHLTLARVKSGEAFIGDLPPTPALRFRAEEVVLYRSHLEPRAARYERLAAAPLIG